MDPAQALLKKAPPADLGKNIKGLLDALKNNPDAIDAVTKKFHLPFEVIDESDKGERPFLKTRYNRIGGADRYRSPWTNKIYPDKTEHPIEDDDFTRGMEKQVNGIWDSYKNLYYGNASVGSVFLQRCPDVGDHAFNGVFCVHKDDQYGSWDAIHFVEVGEPANKMCEYKVTSSVLMVIRSTEDDAPTTLDISATLSKESSKTCKLLTTMINASHIENIGMLIEANEIDLRSQLERVHVPKTQEIMDDILRSQPKRPVMQNPLMGLMMDSGVLKKRMAKSGES